MIKILFICHGNICRSPISEFVLKDIVEKRGWKDQFEIASAATSTEEIWGDRGNPVYPPAQSTLTKHGIGKTPYTNFSQKRARQVTKSDYQHYDYILCADTNNIRNTIRITGTDRERKIQLLMDYAGYDIRKYGNGQIPSSNRSIADPWYTGDFETTYQDVVEGCNGFIQYLIQNGILYQ